MKKIIGAGFVSVAFCLALNTLTPPVLAQTTPANTTQAAPPATSPAAPLQAPAAPAKKKTVKHKKTTRHRKKRAKAKKSSYSATRAHIRTAQIYLNRLGYNCGHADGVIGRKTRAALKSFQRDHHLRVTGTLTTQTYNLLAKEAGGLRSGQGPGSSRGEDFFAAHPDFYGYYGADYANPTMLGSPQTIPSRFGNLQLSDQPNGSMHQYDIALNGKSVFHADNQPSPINVSRTFNLDGADAMLFTTYANGDSICPYRHYLLVVRSSSSGLHNISNCTRSYEAYTEEGSLYILFPGGHVDGWSSGDMWRYESGSLEQL